MNTFDKIKETTKQIPKGRVATYGLIAALSGVPNPRIVGWALHTNQSEEIPCHRVVFADGGLAPNYSMGGSVEQKKKLEKEGIGFTKKGNIDMDKFLWKPV